MLNICLSPGCGALSVQRRDDYLEVHAVLPVLAAVIYHGLEFLVFGSVFEHPTVVINPSVGKRPQKPSVPTTHCW